MKFIVQKVKNATVLFENNIVRKIDKGIVIYCGIHKNDVESNIKKIIKKLEKFIKYIENRYDQKNIELLFLSNFTIYGEQKGMKINFGKNMPKNDAEKFFQKTYKEIKEYFSENNVQIGLYGEFLEINSIVEGPFNFIIEVE